jgi:ABC-type phosphate transport system permease subunit
VNDLQSYIMRCVFQAAVQRSFNKLLTLRGFLAQGWEVLNLEEARASSVLLTNSHHSHNTHNSYSSAGGSGVYPGGVGSTASVRVASEVSVCRGVKCGIFTRSRRLFQ